MNIIQQIWNGEQKQLPFTNSIVFADDSVVILNFTFYQDSDTGEYTAVVFPLCDTSLQSILKYNDDPWVAVDAWENAVVYHQDRKYIGGDGSYGNEGFIACEDLSGNFVWGMFFDNTNPIKELTIKENWLIGLTEHSESQIEINLENLTDIRFIIFD